MHPKAQGGPKRPGQQIGDVNNVAGQDPNDNYLLHVLDTRRNEKWLVDGGSIISIIPPTALQRKDGPVGENLRAANGSTIACYGVEIRILSIGGKDFPYEFTVAAVSQRILGADFLANFYLAPNHRDATLINLKDFSTLPAQHAVGAVSTPVNFVSHADDPCYKLLDSFPEILKPSFTVKNPQHGVRHHIPTTGAPVQSRARRLDQEKLAVAKAEFEKLEALGICHRGRSEWSSPLMVTTKPCGGWRVCGDYRRLNAMTPDDQYPVRTLTDFTSELHGKKFFSKIDLLKGYHQIPVADEDVPKTAVITPFGLWIFPCTPFGLKNAGQDFQRLMDEILGDLPRIFVYIDDILVASETLEQHLQDLELVFKTLAENGMVVQRPKCVLGKPSLEFLGYQVDASGISPLKDRVAAIEQTTPPTTIKELQRFLGMFGYYRRFIPNAATHLFHLHEALKGKPKTLEWTADCQRSFEATKTALAEATLLHHPRPGSELALTTDASNTAIGGVLEQLGPLGWEPLAFWSAKLEPNQRQWPPYDRELLAAFRGTRHFRSWIEGRPFTLYTDHQSLVPSIHKKTDPQTLRQTYQLSCVAEFTTDVRYVEGKANVVADALSRPNETILEVNEVDKAATSPRQGVVSTTALQQRADQPNQPFFRPVQIATSTGTSLSRPSTDESAASTAKAEVAFNDVNCVINAIGDMGLDWDAIADAQTLDPDFRRLRSEARTGLNFKNVDIGNKSIIVDLSNGPARPFIPLAFRRKIFDVFHGLGHPGVERTRQAVAEKVVWPSMRADVTRWARECLACQRAKVIKHTVPPISDFAVPSRRFDHINIDLVTLPPSNGFRYLLTMVDRFTRWPVAVPLVDMTAQSVVDGFSFGWVQNFGVPSTVTSDRGTQFTSEMFQQLARTWGIKTIRTSAYHPEANGLVERLHRRLKEALLALGSDEPDGWFWRLPCVMLSIRTTFKPDVGASPADLVYGEGLAVPGEMLPSSPASEDQLFRQRAAALADLRLEVSRLQPVPTSAHRRPLVHMPESLDSCSHVFVRRLSNIHAALAAPYLGPFKVISRNSTNFKIALPGGNSEVVAIARVKPVYSSREDADSAAETPPQDRRSSRRPRRRSPTPSTSRGARQEQPPASPASQDERRSQSPPIRRRIPRGRARPLLIEDDEPAQMQPQPAEDPIPYPADYDVPVDDVPVWNPPAWFDPGAVTDWGDAAPPPPPPPPPSFPRRKKNKVGNPHWVRGGSFAGARWAQNGRAPPVTADPNPIPASIPRRATRARPDVSAIFTHLGLTAPSSLHSLSGVGPN